MPKPMKLLTKFDRIHLTRDGWLILWVAGTESKIRVKVDGRAGHDNLIKNCWFDLEEADE